MGKQSTYNYHIFDEPDGNKKGESIPFTSLYDTMALSPTFQSLSDSAKYTLMVCKLMRKNHTPTRQKNKQTGKKEIVSRAINGNELLFKFGRTLQKQYGFGNPNKFRESMKELVLKGFIDVIENNGHRKTANVYKYDSKWQMLDCGMQIELSPGAKTYIQGKKTDDNKNKS